VATSGMILGAGLGTRLRPITLERPKPLVEILGEPLIAYTLRHMLRAGVSQIVINTHHMSDQIVDALGNQFMGIPIRYVHEDSILGTGGAIKNAQGLLRQGSDDILLMNGDILIDLDMETLFETHRRMKSLSTLVLKTVDKPQEYGALGSDDNDRVRTLLDLVPYEGPPLLQRMFCGVHVLSQSALDEFPPEQEFSIIDKFYAPLLRDGKTIAAVEQHGYYCDAGTPKRIFDANMDLLAGRVRFKYDDPFKRFVSRQDFAEGSVWLGKNARVAPDARVLAPTIIDDDAVIESNAQVGPFVVVGKGAQVGANASVRHAVLLSGSKVTSGEIIQDALVAPQSRVLMEGA
jgi:NDP-sugar pyrophosphorylase family protein